MVAMQPEIVAGSTKRFTFVLIDRNHDLLQRISVPLMEELPDALVWKGRVLFVLVSEVHEVNIELEAHEFAYIQACSIEVS
jgi:hypothetical protein